MSYNCTRCGKELEEYEDVVVIASGMVESSLAFPDDFEVTLSNGPYLEVLCLTCREEPKPNRVVVEIKSGMVQNVRAERPNEVVVMFYASTDTLEFPYRPLVYGGPDGLTILQLNTVKEEA